MTESEAASVSSTPGNGSGDAGAQPNARDQKPGSGCNDKADKVNKEQRTERGGRKQIGSGTEVEGDPCEDADQGEEDVEADGKCSDEAAAAEKLLHLVEEPKTGVCWS